MRNIKSKSIKNMKNMISFVSSMGRKCRELISGSLTIEAAFVLPFFMFGFMALAMLATTTRAQSTIQYAVDQTAKEVSQYYYVINRLGFNHGGDANDENIDKVDDFIENFNTFQSTIADASEYSPSQINTIDDISKTYGELEGNFQSIKNASQELYGSFKSMADNPMAIISSMATMLKNGAGNAAVCRIIAQPLSKALVQKYISNNGNIDDTLEAMGVVDGMDGIDFGLSTFAIDGKTVNVVAVYKIKPMGFSLIDYTYTVKTTGSTGIWGTNVTNSEAKQQEDQKKSESNDSSQAEEEQEPVSPWDDTIGIQDQFEAYASGIEQSLGSGTRTQSRQGFHFYLDSKTPYPDGVDPRGNFPADSYIKVMTKNVFSSSYYKDGKIDVSSVKSDIKSAANKLNQKVNAVDSTIKVGEKDSTQKTVQSDKTKRNKYIIVVVPENTTAEMRKDLEDIASNVRYDTGVTVIYQYKDKTTKAG